MSELYPGGDLFIKQRAMASAVAVKKIPCGRWAEGHAQEAPAEGMALRRAAMIKGSLYHAEVFVLGQVSNRGFECVTPKRLREYVCAALYDRVDYDRFLRLYRLVYNVL